jgi:DNA polymerase-3 subunit gamma/tau
MARASGRGPEPEPPYDDEPPPYDEEFPPDLHANGAQSGRYQPPAARAATTAGAPHQPGASTQGQTQPGTQPATQPRPQVQAPNPAGGAASVARRGPAFAEKQRYGESVVREILGATFLEEQPHDPAPRTRGD